MNITRCITIMICLTLPVSAHTKDLFPEEAINELILKSIEKNNAALYATFQRCAEKCAFTSIGTIIALYGCYLFASGIQRTFNEKNKVKNGLTLTCCGMITVLIGLNTAAAIT